MYITVNQLAKAINNLERINPEELQHESISVYEIDFINQYGHIIHYLYIDDCSSKKQALSMIPEEDKRNYSDCTIIAYKIK